MKKTKYEKNENSTSTAKFDLTEVDGFVHSSYSAIRKAEYLAKVAARPPNPRLNERGEEVLSPLSVVADIDMQPLTTRQNLARFTKMPSTLVDDGYDAETEVDENGIPILDAHDYYTPDRSDNPPSPHEVRAHKLDTKLTKVRETLSEELKERRIKGATPAPSEPTNGPTPEPNPTAPPSK